MQIELESAVARNRARLEREFADARGRGAAASLRRRMECVAAFDTQVLHELAAGPRPVCEMMRALDAYEGQVKRALLRLLRDGRAIVIGTAFDLGRRDLPQRALIWALAGTPVLVKRPALAGGNKRRAVYGSVVRVPAPKRRPAPDPERVAGWRTIGRGLAGWGGWGNWR